MCPVYTEARAVRSVTSWREGWCAQRGACLGAQGVGQLLHDLLLVKVLLRLPARLIAVPDALPQPLRSNCDSATGLATMHGELPGQFLC